MTSESNSKLNLEDYPTLANSPRVRSKEFSEANMEATLRAMQESVRQGIEAKKQVHQRK